MTDKRMYSMLAALCVVCATVLYAMGEETGAAMVLGLGGTVAGRGK